MKGHSLDRLAAGCARFVCAVQRMSCLEVPQEIQTKVLRLVRCLLGSACFVAQVPLALDLRVFNGTRPGGELPGAGLGQKADLLQLADDGLELGPVLYDGHHRADFAGGATGNAQKVQKVIGSYALETFGDVIVNRECGAVKLIAKARRERNARLLQQVQDAIVEPRSLLPDRQGFEGLVL